MCECSLGSRQAGACIHVTTVIYYLSNMKYWDEIVRGTFLSRGDYLNSVFIDKTKSQMPNEPFIVRNKRKNNFHKEDSGSDSCESILDEEYVSTSESDVHDELINQINYRFDPTKAKTRVFKKNHCQKKL